MKRNNDDDMLKDVAEYQKNMYNPGYYIGTGRVPPTVSAPGNAKPMAVLWFFFAALFAALGLIALFSDVQFASSGLIESDVVNKVIAVVILAAISVFCLLMALGYLRKVRRYYRQKAALKKNRKKK